MPPATSYDLVPYPRVSHRYCHPDRLAMCARLLGLTPPPVEQCRVLDLGCAGGGNLIPIAAAFPESTCVGVDLSSRQVAEGQAEIEHLGLKNIRLHVSDVQTLEPDFGQFDYILVHGLYSWVPAPVRDRLLDICCANLAPNGVAFVSYNTYPGWHGLDAIRRMMLYHVREISDPMERATEARALLDLLVEAADPAGYYGAMLASGAKHLRSGGRDDVYLLHEYLEEINEPVYFSEFADHAARRGLQHLCDAELRLDFLTNFPKPTAAALLKMAHGFGELEQYMDFVRNRQFRQTLLVHAGQPVSYRLDASRLDALWVGSPARPVSAEVDLSHDAVEAFAGRDGARFSTSHPLTKAAMFCLIRRQPDAAPFGALAAEARALAAGYGETADDEAADVLAANLLQAFTVSESLIEFRASAPRFTLEPGARPLASPWARRQAESGGDVTNLRHERILLAPEEARLLRLLDGARDRTALQSAFGAPGFDAILQKLAYAGLLARQ